MTDTTLGTSYEAPSRVRRLLTVAAGGGAALATWALAVPLAGVDLTVRQGDTLQHVGAGSVAAASVLAGLAGWGLLALLERLTGRPRRTWTIVAVVTLALSLVVGPLGGVGGAAVVTLAALHVVVATVLLIGLRPTAAVGRRAASDDTVGAGSAAGAAGAGGAARNPAGSPSGAHLPS